MSFTIRQKLVYPLSVILGLVVSVIVGLNAHYGSIIREVSLGQWILLSIGATLAHIMEYLFFGSLIEYANPKFGSSGRFDLIKKEITRGSIIITIMTVGMTVYMRWFETMMPYYGYYDDQSRSLSTLGYLWNGIVFMFLADSWFYWTHRILHHPKLWLMVHYYHHSFFDTTAFSQISVHYVEGIIHGPLTYIIPCLLYPVHPSIGTGIGIATGIFAIMAHDGEILDTNEHVKHHIYKSKTSTGHEVRGCNYSLYWHFWDYICDTTYNPETCMKWYKKENSLK